VIVLNYTSKLIQRRYVGNAKWVNALNISVSEGILAVNKPHPKPLSGGEGLL
jgi:hypothetical protein